MEDFYNVFSGIQVGVYLYRYKDIKIWENV